MSVSAQRFDYEFSPLDCGNHQRTVRFSHLCEPFQYWYVTREVQHVPNPRQALGPWRVREPGLVEGIAGLEVSREYDKGNSGAKGDSQMGEYSRIFEHDAESRSGERARRIDSAAFVFMYRKRLQ